MGHSPFEPNKKSKQKLEHNGEFDEQHGDLDDQHGKHPQTLNELLIENSESICTTENTNKIDEAIFENNVSPEQDYAMQELEKMLQKMNKRIKD